MYPSRLGKLSTYDWLKLSFAFLIIGVEALIRLILFFLPTSVITALNRRVVKIYDAIGWLSDAKFSKEEMLEDKKTYDLSAAGLAQYFGYYLEQHVVYTADGYQLSLHHLIQTQKNTPCKGVVFLQHGLMQSSEVWLCTGDAFAYQLAEDGFDVWLGNSRGNKYSCKHFSLRPDNPAFWDFSIDEMIAYDVPACLSWILHYTNVEKLAYVGFSQGTALGFGTFSLNMKIANQVSVFIALAPAGKALGLRQGFLQTLVHLAPQSIFLIFGTRALMPWVSFWRTVLSRKVYASLIEAGCKMLFDWNMQQLGDHRRRLMLYSHLFSLASVKTIVHWFQIVASDRFQQYDDLREFHGSYKNIEQQVYPIEQIPCRVIMIYGGADRLTDIMWMKENLPSHFSHQHIRIPDFEHLDIMWGERANDLVFPHIISALNEDSPFPVKDMSGSDPIYLKHCDKQQNN
eukprot:gene7583-7708_t